MGRTFQLIIAVALVAALAACSLYLPPYVGTWVDEETLYGWTITLEFQRREFSIAMESYDAVREVTVSSATYGVMSAEAGDMQATITGQEIDGEELGDPELHAYLAYIGGGEYTAAYDIAGDTITLSGDLVEKIASVPEITARKQ